MPQLQILVVQLMENIRCHRTAMRIPQQTKPHPILMSLIYRLKLEPCFILSLRLLLTSIFSAYEMFCTQLRSMPAFFFMRRKYAVLWPVYQLSSTGVCICLQSIINYRCSHLQPWLGNNLEYNRPLKTVSGFFFHPFRFSDRRVA